MAGPEPECVECRTAEDDVNSTRAEAASTPVTPAVDEDSKQDPKEKEKKADTETAPLPSEPPALPTPGIIIEYCDRCRWQSRAQWIQTELLLTFPCPRPLPVDTPAEGQALTPGLRSVIILPRTAHDEGGIFRVWLQTREGDIFDPAHIPEDLKSRRTETTSTLLWDRKTQGRFPEPKELKQKIRDIIAPEQDLGHSDRKKTSS
ncbi:unnamed protein product [Tilletia controversa]|uniref:Selenoprotein W n=3 Tax=Tilletia TaxID=13289 RepID=A0A8X7MTW9_9BASI|nr:hypothetical protein CF336_g3900 [Tilletia laevis]KAE8198251.1 hypothetical protein CF328_g3608 [Tilletia controversa]KAE8261917.1 hypothetical protein A4X03_0g2869 [Tilletia caries]KAE8203381.1 hypothetical protein CF335_g3046 [Tilletia laevis]KAE8247587.1 hypothetical protein A4X06_0g4345 [Tilletia controversa]